MCTVWCNTVIVLPCSYHLYSISHPDKKGKPVSDLSSDNEDTVENELLAPKELVVERVITKVFSKLQSDVIVIQTTCDHCFLVNCPEWGSVCKVLVVNEDLKYWKNGEVLIGLLSYSTNRRQGKCKLRLHVSKNAFTRIIMRVHALCMQVRVMLSSIPT